MRSGAVAAFLVAGLVLAPAAAVAQAGPGLPRVGVLDWESPSPNRLEPFRQAMRELGYVDGENVLVEYHYAEGRVDRAEALAAELVRRASSVIVAFTTPAAHAAKKATSTIPVVITTADPVAAGLVSNLAHPGGNLTGVSNMMPDLESKRLELLRELMPGLKQVAFLGSKRDPATRSFVRAAQAAAARSGLRFDAVLVADADEIDAAFAGLARDGVGAVIVQPLFALDARAGARLAVIAARHGVPAITNYASFPKSGGLASYGPQADFSQRTVARYVDRILKGARPGDLPIEQPTTFELVVNLKTAKALGITIPESILARADEVIE